MSECCGPAAPCCGGAPADYDYGPEPYVTGTVDTFAGPVKRISTDLTAADSRGAVRVRLGVRRGDYRVRPALYAVGEPDDASPVLVTGNYKLTFDTVRAELGGLDVWLLVIDSRGVNVWCAAGKGVFSTAEVVRCVRDARLEQVVSHTRLVLPQLGATGVAAHEVRAKTGFSVAWGPVRAADLPEYLDAGMKATPEMRRVRFTTRDRAKLVGVELAMLWRWQTLLVLGILTVLALALSAFAPGYAAPFALAVLTGVLAIVAGTVVMPLLLPWLPGRTFSLKGAEVGVALIGIALVAVLSVGGLPLYAWGLLLIGTAIASYLAMNFTGTSTFTSPSGVEWEMRRAIPLQIAAAVLGFGLFAASLFLG